MSLDVKSLPDSMSTAPSPTDQTVFSTVGGCGSRTVYEMLTNASDSTFDVEPLSDGEMVKVVARALYAAGIDRQNITRIVHGANRSSPDAFFEEYANTHESVENDGYDAWWDYIPHDVAGEIVPCDISGVVNQRMRNGVRYHDIECLIEYVDGVTKETVREHPQIGDGQYGLYHKLAGFDRNEIMAKEADAFVAFWDGESSGTEDMIETAEEHGAYVVVFQFDCPSNAPSEEQNAVERNVDLLLPERFER